MKKNLWHDALFFTFLNQNKYADLSQCIKAFANQYLEKTIITVDSNNGKNTIRLSNPSYNNLEYTLDNQNKRTVINNITLCLDANKEKISAEFNNKAIIEITLEPVHKNRGVLVQEYRPKGFSYKIF